MNGEYVEVFKNVVTNYFKTLSYSSPAKIEKNKTRKKTSVDSLPSSKPHSSQTIITTTTYLVACLAHAIW